MSSDSEQSNDQITGSEPDEVQEFNEEESEQSGEETGSESDGEQNDELEDARQVGSNAGKSNTSKANASKPNVSKPNASSDESNVDSDDDAPDEVQFSSTRKTALQLAESQQNVLNRLKRQAQEKRKQNQERNVEQKKLKSARSSARTANQDESADELSDELSGDEMPSGDQRRSGESIIEKETESSRLKIILNVDDQVDRMNNKLIKKYAETNNRMISFKERCIQSNPNIKRVENSEASRLLHKRRVR